MPGAVPTDSSDANASVSEGARVGADSHLTLHYRLTLAERGADIISTFGGKPATLQIGIGLLTLAGALGVIVHALADWTPGFTGTLDSFARAVQAAPEPAGRR